VHGGWVAACQWMLQTFARGTCRGSGVSKPQGWGRGYLWVLEPSSPRIWQLLNPQLLGQSVWAGRATRSRKEAEGKDRSIAYLGKWVFSILLFL